MNANRNFVTTATATEFVITETAPKTDILSPGISRELAWQQARSQAAPVVFVGRDGSRTELGDCWDREVWETAIYGGHISYNLSMTDGYYGPEAKAVWLAELRKFPRTTENDASDATKAALSRWLAV